MISPTTKLFSLDEVAAEIGVHRTTVEDWVTDGDRPLGSFKKGKTRRVSLADLTAFVLGNTLKPKRPAWLTPEVERQFEARQLEMMQMEVRRQVAEAREVLEMDIRNQLAEARERLAA